MSIDGQNDAEAWFAARMVVPRPLAFAPIDYPANSRIAPHSHERTQFLCALSGVLTLHSDDGAVLMPARHALWIPPALRHAIDTHCAVRMRSLYFDANLLPEGWPGRCRPVVLTPLARAMIERVSGFPPLYERQGPQGRLVAALVDELLALPEAPFSLPLPKDPRIGRIARALIAEPADPRSLEAWSREVGGSLRTLARRFRSETGLSFRLWRQRRRLLAAVELLGAGQPVTTVAYDVGFSSPSAFTVAFRQLFGSPPSVFLGGARRPPG